MTRHDRLEQGSALLVAMMLLVLMGLIGMAALQTVSQDRQVAGYQNRARLALYAADAEVALALNQLRSPKDCLASLAMPTGNLGDTTVFPYGQPSYGPDPEVAAAMKCVGYGPADPGVGMPLNMGGSGSHFYNQIWEVHSIGQTADGSVARLETRQTCLAGGK